jgi:phosphatidylglycerol:prolipoprotein diacylglycerol transferase
VVIERVESGEPAGSTSLRAGDVVKSLQLPARRSLDAAQRVAEFAGAALEIETADGQKKQLLIERRSPSDYFAQNDLGFQVQSGLDGPPVITEVAPGGPAQRAGFRVGDELKSIRLPPLPNVEAAENVLQCAGARLTVETEDGRSESWTVGKLRSRSLPVHPTQIYSSINAALLCLLLCAWRPLRRRDGEVVALMLTLYPITRIVEEAIRDDEPGVMGSPLTISQIVSLMALLAAAALWVHLVRRPRRGALAGGQPA